VPDGDVSADPVGVGEPTDPDGLGVELPEVPGEVDAVEGVGDVVTGVDTDGLGDGAWLGVAGEELCRAGTSVVRRPQSTLAVEHESG
jgi:hypothetical protein